MYRWMYAQGRSDVGEASSELGLSPEAGSRAFAMLGTLRLIDQEPGQDAALVMTPEAALRRMLSEAVRDVEKSAENLRRRQQHVTALAENFLSLGATSSDGATAEVLEGDGRIQGLLLDMTNCADEEILSLHPGAVPPPEALELALLRDRVLSSRGVALRSLYHQQFLNTAHSQAYLSQLGTVGVDVRTAHVIPARMLICDRAVALVATADAEARPLTVVLRGSAAVEPIAAMYEVCWQYASPLQRHPDEEEPGEVPALTDQQRAILQMLAVGLKDEKIARHMGISARTLSRTVSELMRALGVDSRFQAGVRAVQQGWVT
ncbi:helix-turn-helix transcriptional regulator [Streptomyces koyangensis]|uniref:helix-turn-helix transcriptional regulator n=1 Tax=Streptomyces koyangensis TaxID=188770 RepID=UPI003C2BE4D0